MFDRDRNLGIKHHCNKIEKRNIICRDHSSVIPPVCHAACIGASGKVDDDDDTLSLVYILH